MALDNVQKPGLGDDQGTTVGKPEPRGGAPKHSETSSPRPDRTTGAAAEATRATGGTAEGHDGEHDSRYGGEGGKPQEPAG